MNNEKLQLKLLETYNKEIKNQSIAKDVVRMARKYQIFIEEKVENLEDEKVIEEIVEKDDEKIENILKIENIIIEEKTEKSSVSKEKKHEYNEDTEIKQILYNILKDLTEATTGKGLNDEVEEAYKILDIDIYSDVDKFLIQEFGERSKMISLFKSCTQGIVISTIIFTKPLLKTKFDLDFKDARGEGVW
jgi:hypothetical protein